MRIAFYRHAGPAGLAGLISLGGLGGVAEGAARAQEPAREDAAPAQPPAPPREGARAETPARPAPPSTTVPAVEPPLPPSQPPREKPDEVGPRIKYEALVTATSYRTSVFDSPRATSVVDKEELRSRPPRTAADALNDEEGVFVQRTGWAGGSPFLRGLTGQQVVLLVDGVRLNNTTTRTGPNALLTLIDPYTIESAEVLRGPSSVLYGSDAVGGVVQVRTRRPSPIAGSEIDLNAGLRGSFASYDLSGQGSLSASGRWGRYALDTAFSLRRFGDVTGGSESPAQPNTGYREGNLYLGGGVDLGKGTLIMVFQGTRQYDALRPDRSQPGDLRLLPEASRDLAYLRYVGSVDVGGRTVALTATASYQRLRELEDRLQVGRNLLDRSDNAVDVMGMSARADADLGRPGHLTGGLDGYFEWVSSEAQRGTVSAGPGAPLAARPDLQRYPSGSTAQTVSLYLQDEIDLERLVGRGDAVRPGRLRALVGVRAGASVVGIGRDERLARLFPELGGGGIIEARRESFGTYAGSLHLRYEPLSGLALSGGFSTAYRAPNLADFARLGAEGLGFSVPSAGLAPEVALSAEGGIRAAFRKLEGAAYYSYTVIDDVLAATPVAVAGQGCAQPGEGGVCLSRYYGRENADQARLHAMEAMGRLHILGGLSLLATVSYVYGTLDRAARPAQGGDEGAPARSEPFYKIPPLNGVAAVQLRRPRSVFNFAELSLRWAGPQDRLGQADLDDPRVCVPGAPACAGTAGFAVLSARGAARLSRMVYLTAAVENLTNTTYRYHGSGIDGPGLGASVTLEANY